MIRAAVPADAAGIAEVVLRSWDAALPTVRRAHPDADMLRYWRDDVLPAGRTWVVDERAEIGIVGVMALAPGWISQLYLAPDHRGRGHGDALVELARQQSPSQLELWTFQVNGPARRFYERHGFEAVELTDGTTNDEREPDVRYVWRPAVRKP